MNPAPEPESVKNMVAQMLPKNGAPSDNDTVARIYADFKWSLKKLGMTGQPTCADITALLDAVIKRCRKQIKDPAIVVVVAEKFSQAKAKLIDWSIDEAKRGDVCEQSQLPKFICPHCQEKSY